MRRVRAADPLREIDLLVGSNLLGLYVRRLLTRRLGALAAVRPLTFLDLARHRAERGLLVEGRRPLPPLGDERLMERIVSEIGPDRYFEPLKPLKGLRGALLSTIRDLKDAGWTPRDLEAALARARASEESRRKIAHVHEVFAAYETALARARLYDRSDLLKRAALRDDGADRDRTGGALGGKDRGAWPDASLLLVYGFYDLIELQWGVLLAEARRRETVVFVPVGTGPAFDFARRMLARLAVEGIPILECPGPERRSTLRSSGRAGAAGSGLRESLPVPPSGLADGGDRGGSSAGRRRSGWLDRLFVEDPVGEAAGTGAEGQPKASVAANPAGLPHPLPFVPDPRSLPRDGDAQPWLPFEPEESGTVAATPVSSGTEGASPPDSSTAAMQGASPAAPVSIRILSAPDESREAVEVAREILAWAEDGIPFHEMAVLGRPREPHLTTVARALERAGVPCVYAAGAPFRTTRAARTVARLTEVVSGDWGRGDVIACLATADLRSRLRHTREGREIALSEWDPISTEAGIVGGRDAWTSAVDRAVARARGRLARLEAEGTGAPSGEDARDTSLERREADRDQARRRFEAAVGLRFAVRVLRDALARWPERGPWSACAEGFAQVVRRLIESSAEREELEAVIEGLGRLDPLGSCPDRRAFLEVLGCAIDRHRTRERRFGRDGVLLADAIGVRGLSFRAVAIVGMVERSFPAVGREDPVLLDPERETLARGSQALPRLPRKGGRHEEERLLFRLALGAARERLLLSWSRLASHGDRPFLPSPFLRSVRTALEQARGDRPIGTVPRETDDGEVDRTGARARLPGRGQAVGARGERIHDGSSASDGPVFAPALVETVVGLLPIACPDPARSVDGREWLLATAAGTPAPALVLAAGERLPFLDAAWRCEAERWSTRRFGAYDGLLGGESAERARAAFLGRSISPTRMEDYARCPLKAFFRHVLGLSPIEDPAEIATIDPADRGRLIHEILARFLRDLAVEGAGSVRFRALSPETLRERLRRVAHDRLGAAEQELPVGYPLMWEIERDRVLADLEDWLGREVEEAGRSEFRPAAFEWSFGASSDVPPVRIAIRGGEEIAFHGRIDRIDLGDRGRVRVVDYKTGVAREQKLAERMAEGRAVQLPVYLLAAERFPGAAGAAGGPGVISAEARYLSGTGPPPLTREDWERQQDAFRRALGILVEAARGGDFTADPRDQGVCRVCDYRDPCGEGRATLFRRKRADPRVAERLSLRSG